MTIRVVRWTTRNVSKQSTIAISPGGIETVSARANVGQVEPT